MNSCKIFFSFYFILFFSFAVKGQDNKITLLGHMDISGYVYDLTGYYDSNTNKEYAIVGSNSGVTIVDVTVPASPVQSAFMPGVPGFDLKVWQNYLYCVTGSGGDDEGIIIDISDPASPHIAGSFYSAHNIFISDSGYLFAESPGLKIYNLNEFPTDPAIVWQDNSLYGHDATVIDNYVYDFHGREGTRIYEISYEPFSMKLLSTISVSLISFHHSGWITEDKNYLFICDEGARDSKPDITVWDISDPTDPQYVAQHGTPYSIIHNLYIVGDFAYTAYYNRGFVVFDVSSPENFSVADEYDPNTTVGEDFNGSFGCYPFTRSGNILISDKAGLFIFSFSGRTTDVDKGNAVPSEYVLKQNYPNPFNPSTKITFSIPEAASVKLVVYDMLGREIEILFDEFRSAGNYSINFNGTGLSSGIYFYKLISDKFAETKKMILAK